MPKCLLMKNILVTLSFILIIFAVLNGCKKDPKKTSSVPFITATGSDATSVNCTDTLARAAKNGSYPYPYLDVEGWTGSSSTSARTGFWIYPYTATPGTYALDGVHAGAFYNQVSYSASDTTRNSAHGTLIISTVSPNITGTFSFTCKDSTVVSGSFNVVAP